MIFKWYFFIRGAMEVGLNAIYDVKICDFCWNLKHENKIYGKELLH